MIVCCFLNIKIDEYLCELKVLYEPIYFSILNISVRY